jgi:hypothetical protein
MICLGSVHVECTQLSKKHTQKDAVLQGSGTSITKTEEPRQKTTITKTEEPRQETIPTHQSTKNKIRRWISLLLSDRCCVGMAAIDPEVWRKWEKQRLID